MTTTNAMPGSLGSAANSFSRAGNAPAERMKVIEAYDPAKDFTKLNGPGQFIEVAAGSFTIFMPHDAHMGGVLIDEPQIGRKIVIKLAV